VPTSIATVTKEHLSGIEMTQAAYARLFRGHVRLVGMYRRVDIGEVAGCTFLNVLAKFRANLIEQDDNPGIVHLFNSEDLVAGFDAKCAARGGA
jgi:hypothetical protein